MKPVQSLSSLVLVSSLLALAFPARTGWSLPDLIVNGDVAAAQFAVRDFATNDCPVLEGCIEPGVRRLVLFNTEIRNIGTSDLVLGSPVGNTNFVFDPCHGHYHFSGYAQYRLTDTNGAIVRTGGKLGFCVEDVQQFDPEVSDEPTYHCGNQGISVGWADLYAYVLDCQWIDITGVPGGNYTIEIECNPIQRLEESDYNNNIAFVDVTIPETINVQITSPTNGFVTTERFLDVVGDLTGGTATSVVVTNSRGSSATATLNDTNWNATGLLLKLGTNQLFAVATDQDLNPSVFSITVLRINTNYINTSFRTTSVKLGVSPEANSDSVSLSGVFNDEGVDFDPAADTIEVLFGDYEAIIESNKLVNFKYKGKASPTNTLTSIALNLDKRTFRFAASGFTLTNLDPFLVAVAFGTNDLGPDSISFPVPDKNAAKYSWKFGRQLPNVDQLFVSKSVFTPTSFSIQGALNCLDKPDLLQDLVCLNIGQRYDETLPANGWTRGAGNSYSYKRPPGHDGAVSLMTIDFDKGSWSVKGSGVDLSFLLQTPLVPVRLEFGNFAAEYRALTRQKGTKFSY